MKTDNSYRISFFLRLCDFDLGTKRMEEEGREKKVEQIFDDMKCPEKVVQIASVTKQKQVRPKKSTREE